MKQIGAGCNTGIWPAKIACNFQKTAHGKTALAKLSHEGPLRIQKLFHDDDLAHCCVLHPPGGLVSGDKLWSRFEVLEDAKVLITTPAAGKLYKARESQMQQTTSTNIEVASGAVCAYLPQDTIIFDKAFGEFETFVSVDPQAAFIGWEHFIFGRTAGDYPFRKGQLIQYLKISRDRRVLFQENLKFTPETLQAPSGLNGMVSCASVTVVLPANSQQTAAVVMAARESLKPFKVQAGVSAVRECLITIRILSDIEEETRLSLQQLWTEIGQKLVDRAVSIPRIWRT